MKRCIVSIAFREPYVRYQDYLLASLRSNGNPYPVVSWRDEFPPGSPTHAEANYAFKLFAIAECVKRGYTSILWLDTSCYVHGSLDPIFDRIERDGHFFIVGADLLGKWASDETLSAFGKSREEAMGLKLVSGTIYGLDFENVCTRAFFEGWRTAFADGLFMSFYGEGSYKSQLRRPGISDDPRVEGHRGDEATATLIAHRFEMLTTEIGDLFGGGINYGEGVLVNSGYDLEKRGIIP